MRELGEEELERLLADAYAAGYARAVEEARATMRCEGPGGHAKRRRWLALIGWLLRRS